MPTLLALSDLSGYYPDITAILVASALIALIWTVARTAVTTALFRAATAPEFDGVRFG